MRQRGSKRCVGVGAEMGGGEARAVCGGWGGDGEGESDMWWWGGDGEGESGVWGVGGDSEEARRWRRMGVGAETTRARGGGGDLCRGSGGVA